MVQVPPSDLVMKLLKGRSLKIVTQVVDVEHVMKYKGNSMKMYERPPSRFGKPFLLLYGHLANFHSVTHVIPTKKAKQLSWWSVESSSKVSASSPSWSWWVEVALRGLLMGSWLLRLTLLSLRLTRLVFVLVWIMNASDMFRGETFL